MNPVEEPYKVACEMLKNLEQSEVKSFRELSSITETMKKVV